MAGTGSLDLRVNDDENIENWSISKLISSLKSTFLPKDFAKVEAVLAAREDKLKLEIATLKRLNDSYSDKLEVERLDKMGFENKLIKCKIECEEARNAESKLREENMVLTEREKEAEERCKNLLEEVKRIGDQDKIMIDLRSRNSELECALAKAESELEILVKRFKELHKRVLNLEGDLPLLGDQEDLNGDEIGGENGSSDNGRAKPDATAQVEEISIGQNCDSPPVKDCGHSPNSGSGRPPSQNIVEIVDSDSDDDSTVVEILSEKRSSHPAENSNSDRNCIENGTATLKRKRTSSIEVSESEDGDNDANALNGKLKKKKLQEPVCRPDDCPLNHCSTTAITSDCNEVNKGLATAREDFMVSRPCEHQPESEQKSENLINGFPLDGLDFPEESSCSSDSDSDDDNDGMHFLLNHSQFAPDSQVEDRN
ncbi:hypothetical protein PTKIN_Ptkin04bG0179000 [Pterospermum kingtungense]